MKCISNVVASATNGISFKLHGQKTITMFFLEGAPVVFSYTEEYNLRIVCSGDIIVEQIFQ